MRARLISGAYALALALAARPAAASGFLLHEQTAAAIGRGGAVTAASTEPAAVWFNPAALATLPGLGAQLTGTYVRSSTRFSPEAGGADTRTRPGNNVVPAIFAHARLHDRFALGFGAYAPFGLAVTWPDGWVGAQQSLRTRLWALAFNPVLAARLTDEISVAAGASYYRGGVRFVTELGPQVGGRADLDGAAHGFGVNVAALWRALPERLHVGASYRSRARLSFSGDADFSAENAALADIFVDQRATAAVTLPDVVSAGVLFRPRPDLDLTADLGHVRWSTFQRLEIDFERPGTPGITIERGSHDPFTLRAGVERRLGLSTFALALRAGAFFDQSASGSDTLAPSAPDAHRLAAAAGLGATRGRASLDLAYLYAHFLPAQARSPRTGADAPPRGTYRTRLHALALTLTWR